MPHGRHIYAKSYDMAKANMCECPQSDHALPYWKCVMQYYSKCPTINLPYQEMDDQYYNSSPSIRFHICHIIVRCTKRGRLLLNDKKKFESVNRILFQNSSKYIHYKRASDNGDNHFKIPYKFLYSINL